MLLYQIFLTIASLSITFLMIMLKSMIMVVLFLIVSAVFMIMAVVCNKKRLAIKDFGNDEYERYLNSLK
jgi:hypothetical protein